MVHAPFRKLGPAFKIGRRQKSFAFPGMDLKYVTGNNLREMRTNGSTQTKKSGTKTDRSYAILNIATTVREERLRELFVFKLYSISDAKRVQIKGKETELMKLTFDTAVPPFELKSRTSNGMTYPLQPSFLQPIRCTNCQNFKHAEKHCKANKPVCPHCAGNHKHFECKTKQNKNCPNCGSASHGAAYKECNQFTSYKREIDAKNRQIQADWD